MPLLVFYLVIKGACQRVWMLVDAGRLAKTIQQAV